MISRCHKILMLIMILAGAGSVHAQEWNWSAAPLLGVYSPQLGGLNKGEFRSPLPGTGGIIIDGEASVDYGFTLRNPLPEIRYATEAGVELQLELDDKYSLIFGIGSWEGTTTSVIQTEIPFQGELSQAIYERSGRVSTTQYFVGWRRNLFNQDRRRLYVRFTLNELMDVDYKEDLVFGLLSGPAEGFKRLISMQSQATGILMLQLGMGGELFLRDWISLGFDMGYMQSIGNSTLSYASEKDDFQSGDSLDLVLPAQVGTDGKLWYLSSDASGYQRVQLDFSGWCALLRINFHF